MLTGLLARTRRRWGCLMGVMAMMTGATDDDVYLTDILLLCVTCKQPIKARINTPQWIRVEWISSEGECQGCAQVRKEGGHGSKGNPTS